MKRGIDIGNYSLKEYPNTNIQSLVTTEENLLGSKLCLEYDNKRYYIGEGPFETELNKSRKENFIPLLLTGIALKSSKQDVHQQIVCGLPINQYKSNAESLEELILNSRIRDFKINDEERKIIITDFKAYPEGVGAYYSLGITDDVIIVDIGGRTTDIAYIIGNKLKVSATIAIGTLNIYKDIADRLNSIYTLDLDITMAERILNKGYLDIDGYRAELGFVTEILKRSFDKINDDLMMKFPSRTEKIILVGGGYNLFEKAFKKRYANSYVANNPLYANSIGFRKVAEQLWG